MDKTPFLLLEETAAAWGYGLSATQLDQFVTYAAELQRWNQRVNLTAITDTESIIVRHFLDSLACMLHWGTPPDSLVDIGSGAGFPGIPLKLLHPAMHLTLIESVGKKAAFLQHIGAVLGLSHVTVLQERAEVVGRDPQQRESYAVATARAVAELRILAEYGLPLLRNSGRLLAPKGADVTQEVAAAQRACTVLGGQVLTTAPVALPGLEPRTLVVIQKIAPTPAAYPRTTGAAARRPL